MAKIKKPQNNDQKSKDVETSMDSSSKHYNLGLIGDIYDLVNSNPNDEVIISEIEKWVKSVQNKYELNKYLILFLVSDLSISRFVSNRIYQALNSSGDRENKDILLVLDSPGGKIEPAYLISKSCKKWCMENFVVSVPRMAKSAATLLSLGADQIHMGQMSELGPIDYQIGDLPALGLTNALNVISQLASEFPQASNMWASYLTKNLNLMHLGYFDRINSSASQYGERLLAGKKLAEGQNAESVTKHLVHHYKDHSFVIDYDECLTLFGSEMVKFETPEYKFANEVIGMLENIRHMFDYKKIKKSIKWTGGITDGIIINKIKDD